MANPSQRILLRIAASIILALLIYPPTHGTASGPFVIYIPTGHQWLWANRIADFGGMVGVNWPVLLTLWLGVVLATALIYLSLRDN